ncbi:MAG: hypothetical protein JSU87_10965 [Gemmatimonadota bacterium]|nr:MAG: hypothetical protein JSU87_10965 [Gemmatimonadota bacterium]
MRRSLLTCFGVALAVVVAASCSDNEQTSPTGIMPNFVETTNSQECDVIDFNGFSHGDAITSVSLFGGDVTLSVSAFRNSPSGAVNATAYDTELWTLATRPNSTHNDTQLAIWCQDTGGGFNPLGFPTDASCDGIMPVVPDPNFADGGDDSQGGSITFTGFSSDFTWTIPSYWAVDDDGTQTITLYIDGSPVGASSGLGNATVELVEPAVQPITVDATLVLEGSGGIDNVEVCREGVEPGLGRITGGGGWIGMTADDGSEVKVTHGFTLHCDIELSNNLEINWPDHKWHIEKEFFLPGWPICYDDPDVSPEPPPAPVDTFEGMTIGKLNNVYGSPIHFLLQDAGEPGGKNDRGMIMIWAIGADPSVDTPILFVPLGFLDHGNLQFHYDQPHGCNVNKPC